MVPGIPVARVYPYAGCSYFHGRDVMVDYMDVVGCQQCRSYPQVPVSCGSSLGRKWVESRIAALFCQLGPAAEGYYRHHMRKYHGLYAPGRSKVASCGRILAVWLVYSWPGELGSV